MSAKNGAAITEITTVRDVMVRYPQAEAIFNKHGLTGCGGPKGPLEPIAFFATVHKVDPEALLRELNEVVADNGQEGPTAVPVVHQEPEIYKPFLKAAMAIVLSVGCGLGAVNLAAMALAGVTGSYWEAVTQAHGHAQIFGWAGLFIMGVAYHVLPRMKSTNLASRSAAMASFWLMLAGIALRMVSQPFAASPSFSGIVVLSAAAEVVAASLFVYVLTRTLASNPAGADFWDKYVVASALWLWVSAVATLAISLYTTSAGIAVIPTRIDGPYLQLSLMGFVGMMILGITLRTIPVFMGLKQPNPRVFDVIFWALNISVLLKAYSGLYAAIRGQSVYDLAGYAGSALEFASLIAFVYFLGVLGRPERNISEAGASRNYEKFIKAAFLWLAISASMSAAYALYQALTGNAVPHSLVGAYRHALTVGFISMMIIGMAARIIPVFAGVRLHSDLMLFATFVLLNLGNAVRVLTQPLAGALGGPLFLPMGISGFIEVTALGLFVYNLWRTIDTPADETVTPLAACEGAITADTIVADALKRSPDALQVLVSHGFTPLLNPIGRRTLARAVTIEEAARMKGVELDGLLRELNGGKGTGNREQGTEDERGEQPEARSEKREPAGEEGAANSRVGDTQEAADEQQAASSETRTVEGGAGGGRAVSPELVTMALRSCYDPEIPVNIVDLGLVYGVDVKGGLVEVKLTLTAPGCPMGDQMVDEVKETLESLPGVDEARVELVFDPPWSYDRMSEEAREKLGVGA